MKNSNICTIYLVRHAESEGNAQGILQGQADYPLTESGQQAARMLQARLKNVHFDAVFSSDLSRAQQTAELLSIERRLIVTSTKLLRELNFGKYNGKPVELFRTELRKLLEERETMEHELRFASKLNHEIESDAEAASRCLTFLRETALAYSGKRVLAVSHGAIIRSVLLKLGFGTYDTIKPWSIKNLGYCVIEADGLDFFITKTDGIELAQKGTQGF